MRATRNISAFETDITTVVELRRLEIDVEDGRRDLIPAAENAWQIFSQVIRHPLIPEAVTFNSTSEHCPADACSKPVYGHSQGLGQQVELILSVPLLVETEERERNLTLLHECIHMDFAFGDHRPRWQRIQQQIRDEQRVIRETDTADTTLVDYLVYRHQVACLLRQVPDEIVAEQRLKRSYPELWPQRSEQYMRMRRGRESQIGQGRPGDRLWPFSIFYEVLRNAFFIPLVDDPPLREELRRLEALSENLLRANVDQTLVATLLAQMAVLLDAHDDRPFPEAEAAYDRLFEHVMAIERRTT